ncbi:MAG: hypothetical protein HW421_2863 [Ignavibacteria bacterium]|nr:hypothetical protein [Ignavibacteria bacterium]
MTESFEVSTTLPASAEKIFNAWLDAKEHSKFTGGGKSTGKPVVGGKFTAWDGYISGKNLILEPNTRIVQSWRTTEFPESSPDSTIEVTFKDVKSGTKITIKHENIPEGQGESYKKGWKDYYFKPMKEYCLNLDSQD